MYVQYTPQCYHSCARSRVGGTNPPFLRNKQKIPHRCMGLCACLACGRAVFMIVLLYMLSLRLGYRGFCILLVLHPTCCRLFLSPLLFSRCFASHSVQSSILVPCSPLGLMAEISYAQIVWFDEGLLVSFCVRVHVPFAHGLHVKSCWRW